MANLKHFIRGILAGICISLGCVSYLSVTNPIIGTFLFSLGLLTVIALDLSLYTGKCGYYFDGKFNTKPEVINTKDLLKTLFGNIIGVLLTVICIKLTRLGINTDAIVATKMNDTWYSMFILSIFCGAMMYIAVEGYKQIKNPLIVVLPVMVFILCGFEHCIADAFYFAYSSDVVTHYSKMLLYFGIAVIGNFIGGTSTRKLSQWI